MRDAKPKLVGGCARMILQSSSFQSLSQIRAGPIFFASARPLLFPDFLRKPGKGTHQLLDLALLDLVHPPELVTSCLGEYLMHVKTYQQALWQHIFEDFLIFQRAI
jgi:hypothetical protein